ncbi:MAG: glycosyltransferase family 2 protein [Ignavibacteria bacterium]|nr:glycosyltransferase family 2 protein [Ignavibacteria bacterium]
MVLDDIILTTYIISLSILFIYGSHGFIMVYYRNKYGNVKHEIKSKLNELPKVTIQLPIYNEIYVVRRLIDTVCEIEYPREKLEIQVLDDSTDETQAYTEKLVEEKAKQGIDIKYYHRDNRKGFKAGALKEGLEKATGEFVAIFDADFVPKKDFLMSTIHYFSDEKVGMVQTRWEHLNAEFSPLTKAEALALDGHFVIEQNIRNKSGFFINFNGTAGIWRKSCIYDAGNWEADTLTEDLDLSYRAQLRGWKFIFLKDVTSPAELPSEINALKSQQFRWTKGAIETCKKILPMVWKSKIPLRVKLQSTFHLTNNFVFPFILIAGILNVPLVIVKNTGNYDEYFAGMSLFVLAFVSSFLFYLYSQKDVYPDWKRRIYLFPIFMAGSMGFAINNTRAVLEGLFNKKSEFVRTPKYQVVDKKDSWVKKKYAPRKVSATIIFEFLHAIWCIIGIGLAIYYVEIAAIPFMLMYFLGYGMISFLSIKHAFFTKVAS